jgi:hypothetical protein
MRWDGIKPCKNIAASHFCVIDVMRVRCAFEDDDNDDADGE